MNEPVPSLLSRLSLVVVQAPTKGVATVPLLVHTEPPAKSRLVEYSVMVPSLVSAGPSRLSDPLSVAVADASI